jgi:hypothetical protein
VTASTVIEKAEDLLPDRLTAILRASGTLADGRVTAVRVGERRLSALATIVPLRAEYTSDSMTAPTRLLLKMTRDGLAPALQALMGTREVAFYRHVAPLMPGGPFPRCYDAACTTGRFHVLMEDLSETHSILTEWPVPPAVDACERIVDAWARLHAYWWRHPRLGGDLGAFLDSTGVASVADDLRERYARFAQTLGDRLGPTARATYARVLEAWERLHVPARLYANYTLAHGDAHVWNVFYPRDGEATDLRIIDWDAWRVALGAADLAYMMALHWYPERRARLEGPLLERYHVGLLAHGVTGYTLEDLRADYRLSVLGQLMVPVWQQSLGIHPAVWWSHLHRSLAAFEDLDCAALLPA